MQSSMAAFPVDVIVEILRRLPVETLLRFRCLSKQIRSIIDGPDFINRHLQNRRSFDQRLIVEGIPPNLFSTDLVSADNAIKLEHPFESWGPHFRVVGSCDGLLALSNYNHTSLGLWNVSTRKHQTLPKFWSDFDMYYDIFDGFGYDFASDDYKWVRIISHRTSISEVTVYSLKANSWRRIEDSSSPAQIFNVDGIGVLVGSALNWVVDVVDTDEFRVMSFDLKSEKFCEVPMPDIAIEAEAEFHVVVSDGCLCLSYFDPFEIVLDIWVMTEYGVKESWTKLFSFSKEKPLGRADFTCGAIALASSKCNDDKVLVYLGNGEVFWYDLEKETNESIEINKWPTYIAHAAVYMDSLVSPNINI